MSDRPTISQIFSQNNTFVANKPSVRDIFSNKTPKKEASIYAKDGVYDQFGPEMTQFNAGKGFATYGPIGPYATQPGKALPMAGQVLGNLVGAGGGPLVSAGAGVMGALGGEGIRQGIGHILGVQDASQSGRQFGAVAKNSAIGEGMGLGVGQAFKAVKPLLKRGGEKIMYNYLRPSKSLAQKRPTIAKDALEHGVKGSYQGALKSSQDRVGQTMDAVNEIIESNGSKEVNLQKAFSYMDEKIKEARFAQNDAVADGIEKLKQRFMQDYYIPKFQEVKQGGFVIKGPGKLTTPEKKTFSMQGMKRSQKQEAGAFGGGRRVIVGKGSVDSPNEYAAMRLTGKKGVSLQPKDTYNLKREVVGPSTRTDKIQIGTQQRPVLAREVQARKQAQYADINNRSKNAYMTSQDGVENTARKAYAKGLKDDLVDTINDPRLTKLNDYASAEMDIEKALADRLPVAMRNDIISLSDTILGGASMANPKVLALLMARKGLKNPHLSTNLAHLMYGAGRNVPYKQSVGGNLSPALKAMLQNYLTAQN